MLTSPPSTTTPSLQAGDPTRNALLDIATSLNRVENIIVLDHADEHNVLYWINPEPRAGNTPPPMRALRGSIECN